MEFFFQSGFQDLIMAPRLMFGPGVLGLECGAKRNFTTFLLAGREKAIMFNHMSLGKKKQF